MLLVTIQCASFTDSNDRQIEPNVVAENIFSMDSCVENLSQTLPFESKIKEHSQDIHSFHNAGNFSANSKALVCVDCSMEECQDESSSKGVLLDVHYI